MEIQTGMWHTIAHCEPSQIANAKKIWAICPRIFATTVQDRLLHKSNRCEIPIDARATQRMNGKPRTYSQEWHFEWMEWVKAMVFYTSEAGTSQMAVFIYLPQKKELQLYSKLRRMSDGPFARRLIDEPQQLFVVAERLILLKLNGVHGGTEPNTRKLGDTIALY